MTGRSRRQQRKRSRAAAIRWKNRTVMWVKILGEGGVGDIFFAHVSPDAVPPGEGWKRGG